MKERTVKLEGNGLGGSTPTQQGQTPGMQMGIRPGAQTMRLPLKIERYVFDEDPQLKGLKRHPKVVGGSSYTLDKATSVTLFLMPMIEGGRFIVESVEFIPSTDESHATVLKADELGAWVDEFGQAAFAE